MAALVSLILFVIVIQLSTCDESCDEPDISSNTIASIDLDQFLSGDESVQRTIAKKFDLAMKDHGFLYLINHGVDDKIIKSMYNATNDFFEKSTEYKMKYNKGKFGSAGFMPYGLQNNKIELSDEFDTEGYRLSDLVESFAVYHKGYNWYLTDPKWSELPQEFSENNIMKTYITHLNVLLSRLHYLASFALELKKNQFQIFQIQNPGTAPIGCLRLNYYFDVSNESEINVTSNHVRLGSHADFFGFTILYTDNVCGLQALINDEWMDIEYKENSFIVNAGNFVGAWTNKRWIAAKHRVIVCDKRKRVSMTFFTSPDEEALFLPMEDCKKCSFTAKEHMIRGFELSQTT